jgi:translation initiation factor IF-2
LRNISSGKKGVHYFLFEVLDSCYNSLDLLEDLLLLTAEELNLRADDKGDAEGVVIESKMQPGFGPVATLLVQLGTLKVGDYFVVGQTWGKVSLEWISTISLDNERLVI